MARLIAATVT